MEGLPGESCITLSRKMSGLLQISTSKEYRQVKFSMGPSNTLTVFVMLFEVRVRRYHSAMVRNYSHEDKSNLN